MIPHRIAFSSLASLVSLAFAAPGCAKNDDPVDDLPSFHDVSSAPSAIRKAANAVVRIQTAGEAATGSFVSATGLLLTNNHVLGVEVCPTEGCYPQITFKYERGQVKPTPMSVFAVPVAVDVGLDMALVQLFVSPGGNELATPDFLTIASHDAPSLVGTHVTIVGHPEAALKKWTAGEVIDIDGDWIWSTAYTVPGDSGSPILDDAGKMVGILHRGPTSEDLFTSAGVNIYSIGTASAPLLAAMKAPLPSAMISVMAAATAADVVAHDRVYLNAHATTALGADSLSTFDILSALGDACDAGLARTNYESPEDLTSALAPCVDAMKWIECRTDAQPIYALECPADTDAWASRFDAMTAHWRAMNGELDLGPVTNGKSSLDASMQAGVSEGAGQLMDALLAARAPLDLNVASYLAAFGVATYQGHDTLAYVTDYAKVPDYPLSATAIAVSALYMANNGMMTRDACVSLLAQLAGDSSVDVGSKLYIEAVQYNSGLLQ